MRSEQRTLTWQQAKALVEQHSNARPLRETVVERYVRDMKSGAWVEQSAQGLIFDDDGVLVDGQHRLSAQVRAKLTLTWWCTYGGQADGAIDRGAQRSVSDVLHRREASGRKRVAIARFLAFVVWRIRQTTAAEIAIIEQMYAGAWFERMSHHRGWPKAAPFRAALIYASPDMGVFDFLLDRDDHRCHQLEILRSLGTKSVRFDEGPELFFKTLTVIDAFERDRPIQFARPRREAFEIYHPQWRARYAEHEEWRSILGNRIEHWPYGRREAPGDNTTNGEAGSDGAHGVAPRKAPA